MYMRGEKKRGMRKRETIVPEVQRQTVMLKTNYAKEGKSTKRREEGGGRRMWCDPAGK